MRSIMATGRVLMSRKLWPTSLEMGAMPARRPLTKVRVEERPSPRRLNWEVPCR